MSCVEGKGGLLVYHEISFVRKDNKRYSFADIHPATIIKATLKLIFPYKDNIRRLEINLKFSYGKFCIHFLFDSQYFSSLYQQFSLRLKKEDNYHQHSPLTPILNSKFGGNYFSI